MLIAKTKERAKRMSNFIQKPDWLIPGKEVTPEHIYMNRRKFLKTLGFTAGAIGIPGVFYYSNKSTSVNGLKEFPKWNKNFLPDKFPAKRNTNFNELSDRPTTEERLAASYNNFYEFTTDKGGVWELAENFPTEPWTIEIAGLVKKPKTYSIDDLLNKFQFEERVYRFRCVEAWSMVVPWVGFKLLDLIKYVEPLQKAKYVRFVSFYKPDEARGQKLQNWYNWPYYEGLRMDEAMNELTLLCTGMYGHALPNQNGAPLRVITPWKYGYKSAKSIVKIEFVEKMPKTFWNDIAPNEYGFYSNVNPKVPHPRWSQATERSINTNERIPTLPYNGYKNYVGNLYS